VNDFDMTLLIPIISVAGGLLVVIVAITMGIARKISQEKQQEESRREIAAYVAEGSMSPEDAERLLKA
jgi:small neutral amino acid transporter SnatA (MarC family)